MKIILILIIILLLSGCSSSVPEEKELHVAVDDEIEVCTKEAEVRAPIFTYGEKQTKLESSPHEIMLMFHGEPVLISNHGYVRLTGIVGEKDPLAIVEVGGSGIAVKVGENIGEYVIQSIMPGSVKLKKKVKPNV